MVTKTRTTSPSLRIALASVQASPLFEVERVKHARTPGRWLLLHRPTHLGRAQQQACERCPYFDDAVRSDGP